MKHARIMLLLSLMLVLSACTINIFTAPSGQDRQPQTEQQQDAAFREDASAKEKPVPLSPQVLAALQSGWTETGYATDDANVRQVLLAPYGGVAYIELNCKGYEYFVIGVTVSSDYTVRQIEVIESGENPATGGRALEAAYLDSFCGLGREAVAEVDGVSGATYTSHGLRSSLQYAIEIAQEVM